MTKPSEIKEKLEKLYNKEMCNLKKTIKEKLTKDELSFLVECYDDSNIQDLFEDEDGLCAEDKKNNPELYGVESFSEIVEKMESIDISKVENNKEG